jgi:uncharacterized membrane protein YphA (DoxX/SURF4 family)
MNKLFATRAGILLYSIVIAVFGVNHFMNAKSMTAVVPSFMPGGIIWVYITGAALVLAAIAFIIGKYITLAGWLLALMFLIIILTIHLPGMLNATDETAKTMSMVNILKDAGLVAGALMIAGSGKG